MNGPSPMPAGTSVRTRAVLCQPYIDGLRAAHAGIAGVLVSSTDGFAAASNLSAALSASRLAAMTSSQLALAQAICGETGVASCQDVVLEAGAGRLLMMSIPSRPNQLVLTVICDSSTTLGQVMWAVRGCAAEMGRRLDSEPCD